MTPKEKIEHLTQQVRDAERIGEDDWARELQEEIAELEEALQEIDFRDQSEETPDPVEPIAEQPKTEKELLAEVRNNIKNGVARYDAFQMALNGVRDNARRVYLRNLFERRIKK
jgi:hypothetical protein